MNDDDKQLADRYQERMCDLCEHHVYGCKMNTYEGNLCEGARCDEALKYLKEDLELDEEIDCCIKPIKEPKPVDYGDELLLLINIL